MAMNEKIPYWGSVGLSAVAMVLLVVNVSLLTTNRSTQADVGNRQNTIASGQTMNQVNQALVQAMAQAAIKDNDTKMRDLLTAQGITLKTEPTAAAKPAEKTDKTKENTHG
jgi:hypothetical protein